MEDLQMLCSNEVYFDQSNEINYVQHEIVIGNCEGSDMDLDTQKMYDGLCPMSAVNNYPTDNVSYETETTSSTSNISSNNSSYGYSPVEYSPYTGNALTDRYLQEPTFGDNSTSFSDMYRYSDLPPLPPPSVMAVEANVDTFLELPPPKPQAKSFFPHSCGICMFATEKLEDLQEHFLDHIGGPDMGTYLELCLKGKKYYCSMCSYSTELLDQFSIHSTKHKVAATALADGAIRPGQASEDEQPDDISQPQSSSRKTREPTRSNLTLHHCTGCNFTTYNQKQLAKHELNHKQKSKYVCSNCSFTTASAKAFYLHKQTHTSDDRRFPCPLCDYRGRTKSGLNQHKQTHKSPRFKCKYCVYVSCKQSRIVRHELIHTGLKPFQCTYCDFKCNQCGTLNIHIRRHTGVRPYKCKLCSFATISCSSLKTHNKKHASQKRTHLCTQCHQVYLSKGSLKVHMKEHETVAAPVQKGPQQRSNRAARVPKENKQPFYVCKDCNFKCDTYAKLSQHNDTHKRQALSGPSPPKIHACPVCGEEFKRVRAMRMHADTHLSEEKTTVNVGEYVLKMESEDNV